MSRTADDVMQQLLEHPKLLERVSRLLDIVKNEDGKATRADDAEARVICELRELGKETLQEWGKEEEVRCEQAIHDNGVAAYKKQKKNSSGIQRTVISP